MKTPITFEIATPLVTVLVTVNYQTWKAIRTKPVRALQSEVTWSL